MNATEWNTLVSKIPGTHVLQSWEWGEIKKLNGWQAIPKSWDRSAAALILQKRLPLNGAGLDFKISYIPRGPLLDWHDADQRNRVLDDIQDFSRTTRSIFIKMDPEIILGRGIPGTEEAVEEENGKVVLQELSARGWRFSEEQIQFRNTMWLDVSAPEETWLSRMKQKARYNLRLSQKKGVVIRLGGEADLPALYRMYFETAGRDGFIIRTEEYYLSVWKHFLHAQMAHVLVAQVEGQPVAGVILFHFAQRAWYLYGMSSQLERDRMPNYLLQWEAMKLARSLGCSLYDMWGAPDVFNETDSMWNVFRFKEGWGGEVIRTPGAWDYTAYPQLYRFYTGLLPRVLAVMRRQGKNKAQHQLAG